MVTLGMALLAKPWFLHLQHSGDYRAVWIVADGAILSRRLMLIQERSPFFSVTLMAGLGDGMFYQL